MAFANTATNQFSKNGYGNNLHIANGISNSRYRSYVKQSNKNSQDNWGQKTNPFYKPGNFAQCAICQLSCHWATGCPNKA